MIINCKKCFELGYKCPECKEKNRKELNRKELAEKTTREIKKGNQKNLR